jgi:hypothetical protein
VGKGVGAGREEPSQGQEKLAKGPRGRLQERAEPRLGESMSVACLCHREGARACAAPLWAVLSPRRLDGRRGFAGGTGCLEGRL